MSHWMLPKAALVKAEAVADFAMRLGEQMPASLAELLGVPPPQSGSIDWTSVERDLGMELPHDYKRFVSSYGAGRIDNFLAIFTLDGPTQWVDLVWRSRDHDDIFFHRREHHPLFRPYPTPGGLLAFGQTDNGDVLYWRTNDDPSQWTVLIYEGRGPNFVEFAGSMTSFLKAVLSRRVRVKVFPHDFPSDDPRFAPFRG